MIKVDTVFLDRDGVINRKRPEGEYVKCWKEFEFLRKAKEALRLLKEAGLRLVIVTNQRGIARGFMTEVDLSEIHSRMQAELVAASASVDAIYYCPHDEGACDCRKPRVGMFLQAQEDFPDIDFGSSVVIGDSLLDMEAGARLGCETILIVDAVREPELVRSALAKGIPIGGIASSLFDAVAGKLLPALRHAKRV